MDKRTFDDFDEFAADYRGIHTDNIKLSGADSFYFAEMKVRLLQSLEPNQPLRVLDLGCGDGATELFMQQYFPAWQVSGIDVSADSIAMAQQRNISNASFLEYDGSKIPFADATFDLVFVAGVFHHVAYELHDGLMQEIVRVLKKGGRLLLYEHNPLNPLTRYLVNTCVFDKDARLLKSAYTCQLVRKQQLNILQKQFIIFFPRKGILSKLIFLEKYLQWLPLGGQYFLRVEKAP